MYGLYQRNPCGVDAVKLAVRSHGRNERDPAGDPDDNVQIFTKKFIEHRYGVFFIKSKIIVDKIKFRDVVFFVPIHYFLYDIFRASSSK